MPSTKRDLSDTIGNIDNGQADKGDRKDLDARYNSELKVKPIKIAAKNGTNITENGKEMRKGSVVSFKDTCDLYEVDLEKGERNNQVLKLKPPALLSVRYYIMILALISPFVVTYSRTIINFAIIDMIDSDYLAKQQQQHSNKNVSTFGIDNTTLPYFDRDNSCPVNAIDRERLINESKEDKQRDKSNHGEKFQWDTFKQGLLKAAYTIGHAPLQIPGSRLSEIYGSYWVMSFGSLVIATSCLLAPYLAAINFYLVFADLVILGMVGSFMTPAMITLFSNWLTPTEKSMMVPIMLIASRFGTASSSLLCGLFINAKLSWRYVFFSAGWVAFTFATVFLIGARSRPSEHPLISQLELDYLASKNNLVRESLKRRAEKVKKGELNELKVTKEEFRQQEKDEQKSDKSTAPEAKRSRVGAPWFSILTNIHVWAFIMTKFCIKLAGDTVTIELPTYLNRVMHFTAKDNGFINAGNYVVFCLGCFTVGLLSKVITKKRPFGMSKTAIRKSFQCFASFGVSLILLGVAYSVCQTTQTQILLILFFFVTTFASGGEGQIPLDITERYSGTIHAIGGSLAVSGAIEPILVGFLMRGHAADQDSWKGVWLGASLIAFLGGLVFLFFADATIQPFDSIGVENSEDNDKDAKKPSSEKIDGCVNKAFEKEVPDESLPNGEAPHRESIQI